LTARQHTTTSATPVATAIAAWWTMPIAAPPPWGTRLKNARAPMPTARATSISSLVSSVKVVMPSTSAGRNPQNHEALAAPRHRERADQARHRAADHDDPTARRHGANSTRLAKRPERRH
jgi:hypothetical protein